MKSFTQKAHIAIVSLSLSIPLISTDYFTSGLEYGKNLEQVIGRLDTNVEQLPVDETLTALLAALSIGSSSDESHHVAFKELKEYYRGMKEALSSYVPSQAVDSESQAKNYLVTLYLAIADSILESPDMGSVRVRISEIMAQTFTQIDASEITLAQIPFEIDENHSHYKEGYSIGKITCEWMTLMAQGKAIPDQEQIACQKRTQEFFSKAHTDQASQSELLIGSLQFMSGVKKALEEYNLEETITQYKSSKELADKVRAYFKTGLDTTNSTITTLQNPRI